MCSGVYQSLPARRRVDAEGAEDMAADTCGFSSSDDDDDKDAADVFIVTRGRGPSPSLHTPFRCTSSPRDDDADGGVEERDTVADDDKDVEDADGDGGWLSRSGGAMGGRTP
jgi:hypothetical protein